MDPKDLDKLIQKYVEGNCTKEEFDLIDRLYSSLGGRATDDLGDTAHGDLSAIEERLSARLRRHSGAGQSDGPSVRERHFNWRYFGIAASLVFLVAAGYFINRKEVNTTPVAQQPIASEFTNISNTTERPRRVILPDGSLVVMSPHAGLRFSKIANTASRELFLEGEAYFDVAHDPSRPFFVYAGNVITKVLGTSFIVRNQPGDEKVTISVKTGKVTVYSRTTSHKKTVLTPNEEAVYDQTTDLMARQSMSVQRQNEEMKKNTEMHFEETPVSDVLTALTKAYDIGIEFQEEMLSGCVLTSSFYEEGLYDRIDVICTAIGATYKIVDAQIVIESKGCNLKLN